MNRDDIIRMAREADAYAIEKLPYGKYQPDRPDVRDLHFAALVAAAERNKAVENAERYRHAMREAMYLLDQPEPRPHAAFAELLLALNPAIDNRKKSFIDATRSET